MTADAQIWVPEIRHIARVEAEHVRGLPAIIGMAYSAHLSTPSGQLSMEPGRSVLARMLDLGAFWKDGMQAAPLAPCRSVGRGAHQGQGLY